MLNNQTSRRGFLCSSVCGGLGLAIPNSFTSAAELQPELTSFVANGSRHAVATAHSLASSAAMRCFERGGNAIDAAVAASLMLSVVDGHNSGLGGGGLALIRLANGKVMALDGRETAPMKIASEHFLGDSGEPDSNLSQEGYRAIAVPGLVALLERLSREFGRLNWQDSLLEAAKTADDGYPISAYFARVLQATAARLRKYPSSAAVLLDAGGQPWKAGHQLRQVDLARTLRMISKHGADWFYRGEFAERIQKWMLEGDGLLSADDMDRYQTVYREPITCDYRGHRVFGFPPPSSGGVHLAQMLGMLAEFDLGAIFRESIVTGNHLLLEVMKRAMADRVHWLGDADFANVPRGLIDLEYLRERAAEIDLSRATAVSGHGTPQFHETNLFGRGGHTTHLTTADSDGNVVALTQTINTSFGSKMILPGTGVVMNNEMDDFSLAPGVHNAFGLLGSEANKIEPNKRPLSSMSPTIVTDTSGESVLSTGAAGGPRIITAVLQNLIRVLDLHQPIGEALSAPRLHHQWSPDRAVVENAMPESIVSGLKKIGHDVQRVDTLAVSQAVATGTDHIDVASDPRVPSAALAF